MQLLNVMLIYYPNIERIEFMVHFIGYLLPCIILSYILLTKRKVYSLFLLIFFILDLLNIFVINNLSAMESIVMTTIELLLFFIGIILFYNDYKKNKK